MVSFLEMSQMSVTFSCKEHSSRKRCGHVSHNGIWIQVFKVLLSLSLSIYIYGIIKACPRNSPFQGV